MHYKIRFAIFSGKKELEKGQTKIKDSQLTEIEPQDVNARETRRMLETFLRFVFILICSLLFGLEALKSVAKTSQPVFVVQSQSMSPVLSRGDVILVKNSTKHPLEIGDVVVFRVCQ